MLRKSLLSGCLLTVVLAAPARADLMYTFTTILPAIPGSFGALSGSFIVPDAAISDGVITGEEITSYSFTDSLGTFAPPSSPFSAVIPVDPVTGAMLAGGNLGIDEGIGFSLQQVLIFTGPGPQSYFRLSITPTESGFGVGTWTSAVVPEPGHDVPIRISGSGTFPNGMPVFPGGTAPYVATGHASQIGKYSGEGQFELLSLDLVSLDLATGSFEGSFVFVAANGKHRLATVAANPGRLTISPDDGGMVVVRLVMELTPVPASSAGRFADVTGGSIVLVAISEPFSLTPNAQGFTSPFAFTWAGDGSLVFSSGK
jgi:hypothetical protein